MTRLQLCAIVSVLAACQAYWIHSCLAAPATTPATQPATEPTTAPVEKPVTPEEAVYQSNVSIAAALLDNPTADDLVRIGKNCRYDNDYARAAIFYLTALRSKPNDFLIEYELACDFALWGQTKLGMRYFQAAADHGYWGYLIVKDDTDVDALKTDPAFPLALKKIEASFAAESPRHAPGMTVKTPDGKAPKDGWPVVVLLHGWGSNRHDFDEDAEFVTTLGYVGITLDANEVMGPDAYTWTDATETTSARVQAALKESKVTFNARRVYLQGFSQGAMHAARILADHPELYAGAICNSPGSLKLVPRKLSDAAHTGTIYLSIGDAENAGIGLGVRAIEKLWKQAGRPVHVIHFPGGHQLPPDPQSMFRTALEDLSAVK